MNRLSISFFSCILFLISLPVFANDPGYGITSMSVINLRQAPSFAAEMGSQTLMGTPLRILEKENGWIRVMTPEGYISWSTESSVKVVSETEYKAWNASPQLIVTDYFTTLRSKPSSTSEVVSDVVWGDIVRNLGEKAGYYKVKLPDDRIAYLERKSSMPFAKWLDSRKPTPANIIATAKHFIGFPYFWGGTSVKGMDCSGFTKTCFYLNGVILLRDASEQAQTGEDIDISQNIDLLQPGDLIFFGPEKENVRHVGLYIGKGEFIHSSGYVHISSFIPGTPNYDAWNAARLLCAKRIITQIDRDPGIVSIRKHPFYQ